MHTSNNHRGDRHIMGNALLSIIVLDVAVPPSVNDVLGKLHWEECGPGDGKVCRGGRAKPARPTKSG